MEEADHGKGVESSYGSLFVGRWLDRTLPEPPERGKQAGKAGWTFGDSPLVCRWEIGYGDVKGNVS